MTSALLSPGTVKICSLGEVAHAEFVMAAGADLYGLNFAESRRRVSAEIARAIVDEMQRIVGERAVRSVGVFVNQPSDEVNRIADEINLDFVQLHGDEPPEFADLIERPVIRAFRTRPGLTMQTIENHFEGTKLNRPEAALVDGYHVAQHGGTGVVADWGFASEVASSYPVILAGGLTPESVAMAITSVRPLGVDVSSGVEVDGRKDRDRIISFVHQAKLSFAALTDQKSKSSRSNPVSMSS